MNIEALKTFIAVAELKNFTKAAQHLIVVQSTVTNRIKELEHEIGQQLLVRTNKTVLLLTPENTFFLMLINLLKWKTNFWMKSILLIPIPAG